MYSSQLSKNLKILNDKEIKNIKDFEDYGYIPRTIRRIIHNSETPITVGVYGDWGAGKTSVMMVTKNLLETDDDIKTVWFNAWKFDQSYDLRVALIQTILKEMEKEKKLKDKLSDFSRKIDWISATKIAASIVIGSPFFGENLLKQKEIIYLINELNEKFNDLVREYTNNGVLVVFVDDLDRCLPEKAIDVLEAIKLFLDSEQCVFVIGVNRNIIEEGIKIKYKEIPISGRDYMEKIIQVSLNLPELRQEDVGQFIKNIAPEPIKKYDMIISKIGGNPRRIKRLINKFILQLILAEENTRLRSIIDEGILAKLLVIELRWYKFYTYLVQSYSKKSKKSILLNEMKELISTEKYDEIKEKIKLSKNSALLTEFYGDHDLIDFLNDEPVIWGIELGPYIFLRKSAVQDQEETPENRNVAPTVPYQLYEDSHKGVYERDEEPDRPFSDRLNLT